MWSALLEERVDRANLSVTVGPDEWPSTTELGLSADSTFFLTFTPVKCVSLCRMEWNILQPDPETVSHLQKEFKCSETIAKVLANRGFTSLKEAQPFFNPSLDQLHDPFLMKDMDIAVDRIIANIKSGKPILVFGDYDVDGTTGAAVLFLGLQTVGGNPITYIPNRETEGYGLSTTGIDCAVESKADLIITCDCGISAFEEIAYANSHGIDVIITDHHTPGESLPDAYAVLNPKRQDCFYPFKGLCGGGVAFKLISALAKKVDKSFDEISGLLSLITLGTAADLVPLRDENRSLVFFGLNQMKSPSSVGLSKLLALANLSDKVPSVGQLVFGVAPRINAAGRLGDANRSVHLLTTNDENTARDLARELDEENKRRRQIQAAVVEDAIRKVNAEIDLANDKAIVVWGIDWHPGVVGIAASKLKEEFHRPAIVISVNNQSIGTGSARSVKGLDLYSALTKVKSELEGYGGHPMAAGLTVKEEKLEFFRNAFVKVANEWLSDTELKPEITLEGELQLNDISPRLMEFLDKLAPFGPGNMRPKFYAEQVEVSGPPKVIGDGSHIRFTAKQNGSAYNAVGFNLSEHYEDLITGNPVDLAFVVEINEWNNQRDIQLNVRDIRPSS